MIKWVIIAINIINQDFTGLEDNITVDRIFIRFFIAHLPFGLTLETWETAFIATLVVGILNVILWPLLSRVLLPFMVFTIGIGALLINGALIWLDSNFIDGITIKGAALILTPLAMAAISTILNSIATIDDDATWYRGIRKDLKKVDKNKVNDKTGIIFMEIDGLAKNILLEAIER